MTAKKILEKIKKDNITFVDFRFTDPRGKWHHTSFIADQLDEELLTNGIMFDGSSIAGWKSINESDMIMMPDADSMFVDPFTAQPTLVIACDIIEPSTGKNYDRDPRSTGRRAESYLRKSGIGDKAFFGPELEFFVFDDVRFESGMYGAFYELQAEESPENSGSFYEFGNLGHRPSIKGGYFPIQPVDSHNDLRAECMTMLKEVGMIPLLHHHEVAPCQNELGFKFSTLVGSADNVQKYKYVIHNVAHSYGKTATFMPKPLAGDNGSGMHVHQSVWKGDKPSFAGKEYAELSQTALYNIGGVLKHARAINAFSNSATNSYKRLVPGYEAPTLLAYSSRNRPASIRIPHTFGAKAKRIETRFPDAAGNPYYTFAALLMAGLDGIENKIDPGKAMEKNLYELPEKELKSIPTVAGSLREALAALDKDRKFLTKGGVFSDDQIDAYIELKMEEVKRWEVAISPVEFKMYYSV